MSQLVEITYLEGLAFKRKNPYLKQFQISIYYISGVFYIVKFSPA